VAVDRVFSEPNQLARKIFSREKRGCVLVAKYFQVITAKQPSLVTGLVVPRPLGPKVREAVKQTLVPTRLEETVLVKVMCVTRPGWSVSGLDAAEKVVPET
jgi:hypothetical protein